ncbi:calcyphosin isoform X1 [Dermochelys coriacea]|uniref:calcyphosin isoform X1 n=1 Tax=Dermochelys coriacea TaxID=27794 RepID=UPI0018E8F994|nr:calcyphosin isoform X1 [Dermochelys coriacea]
MANTEDQGMEMHTNPIEKLRAQCLARGSADIKSTPPQCHNSSGLAPGSGVKCAAHGQVAAPPQSLAAEISVSWMVIRAGITLGSREAQEIFSLCDKNGSGMMDFEEFLEALRPPMSATRKWSIADAFNKLDKIGAGMVSVEDLHGVYDGRTHSKYQSGERTEEQVFRAFLDSFDSPHDKAGKVAGRVAPDQGAGLCGA